LGFLGLATTLIRHRPNLIIRYPKALVGANGRTPKRRSKLRPYLISGDVY
jgi:hypothetical protein